MAFGRKESSKSFQDRDEWVFDGRSLDEFEEFGRNMLVSPWIRIVEFADDATKYCGDSFGSWPT